MQFGRVNFLPGCGDDAWVEPQAVCDRQRVGAPRQTDYQFVGWTECVQVEFEAGVGDAFGGMGVRFQLGVMRGDNGRDSLFEHVVEYGARQSGTFLGVGASAELVQEDKRTVVGTLEDPRQLGDMPGEGRKRLLNGLLIADVSKNIPKDADPRTGLGGNLQPGLRHQRHQPNGLQGDGLAAGVGTGKHHREDTAVEFEVDWDDFPGIQQGVAGSAQLNDAAGVGLGGLGWEGQKLRLIRVEVFSIAGFHQRQVDVSHRFGGQVQALRLQSNLLAEQAQNTQHLIAFCQFELTEFVVQLNDRYRFDEKGGAGGALVVDDGFNLPFMFSAQRQNVAP